MTQNEKDLLLKDLCARLPYGVMAKFGDSNPSKITNITQCIYSNSWFVESEGEYDSEYDGMSCQINNVKPYLFPLSSMTEEQKEEFNTRSLELQLKVIDDEIMYEKVTEFEVDFYNKHHLDWRGIIPMGLAIDATGLNIY